jgi:hypothetical protein
MTKRIVLAAALSGAACISVCAPASAEDVLMTGYVQQVILQPRGSEHCPEPCPEQPPVSAGAPRSVCVSNAGGCQTIEIKVGRVVRGQAAGPTRRFASRIGEWGPSYPLTNRQIVVGEEGGRVVWSPITQREGRIFIDPKRLGVINGVTIAQPGDGDLLALDDVLARAAAGPAR